jgi:hypothetical protein
VSWINLQERLPLPDQVVVITGFRGNAPDRRFLALAVHSTRQPGDFFDGDTGDVFYPATHWMHIDTWEGL